MGWAIFGEVKERPGKYTEVTAKHNSHRYMSNSQITVYATKEAARRANIALAKAELKFYQDELRYSPAYRKAMIKRYQELVDRVSRR